MSMMSRRRLCIVIPCHNEASNVTPLAQRLVATVPLDRWQLEILFVDDGSTDGTIEAVRNLRGAGLPVSYLSLSRSFGHQAALGAGLEVAVEELRADAVITMDADFQHPPEEIPRMIEAHESGADVVQMVRNKTGTGQKGLFSRGFYWFFNHVSSVQIVPNAADFRLLSRPVAEVLLRIPEREKFWRGLVPSIGFKQVIVFFDEGQRVHGKPSYRFWHSARLAHKAMFDFSTVPLKIMFVLGFVLSLLSFAYGAFHVVNRLFLHHGYIGRGFTDVVVSILFLGGCILLAVGILGRYLVMILEQVRGRPSFIVKEQVVGRVHSSQEQAHRDVPAESRKLA